MPPKKPRSLASALLASPTADSLWAISGGNRPATAATGLLNALPAKPLGSYHPLLDLVALNTETDVSNDPHEMRDALIHEAGHRTRARGLGFGAPGNNAPFRVPDSATPAERQKVDSYYQKSPHEGYAQAFKNAFNIISYSAPYLRENPSTSRQFVLQSIADVEARTPGAGEILRDLLYKNAMFKDHPLRQHISER